VDARAMIARSRRSGFEYLDLRVLIFNEISAAVFFLCSFVFVCGHLLVFLLVVFYLTALINVPIYYGYNGKLVGRFDGQISGLF
jgi:hypothetical protein